MALATPTPPPLHAARIFFFIFCYIWILYEKNHFPYILYKTISQILAATPPHPPTEKKNHLCIILWTLVQSYTVNGLILFGGPCDLYIMVHRFCLVSLKISKRKTSYRSLKQTAGSTSCPWTTILVYRYRGSYTSRYFIWNLGNEPSASFINFIWNDHECEILFIICFFKWDLKA